MVAWEEGGHAVTWGEPVDNRQGREENRAAGLTKRRKQEEDGGDDNDELKGEKQKKKKKKKWPGCWESGKTGASRSAALTLDVLVRNGSEATGGLDECEMLEDRSMPFLMTQLAGFFFEH